MKALKDLGLDVSKGTVSTEGAVKQTKLFITRLYVTFFRLFICILLIIANPSSKRLRGCFVNGFWVGFWLLTFWLVKKPKIVFGK